MWVITKDHLNEEDSENFDHSQVGTCTPDCVEEECVYKFKLYDDDDILYYEGSCDTNDDDNAFEPLDYYEADSGCTRIDYLDESTGEWETL